MHERWQAAPQLKRALSRAHNLRRNPEQRQTRIDAVRNSRTDRITLRIQIDTRLDDQAQITAYATLRFHVAGIRVRKRRLNQHVGHVTYFAV